MTMHHRRHSQQQDDEHSVGSGGHLSSTPPLEPSQYNPTDDTEDDTTTMGDSGTNQHSHTNSVLPRMYQHHGGGRHGSGGGGTAANHYSPNQPPHLMCIGAPPDADKEYHCCTCIGCEPPITPTTTTTKNFALTPNDGDDDDDGQIDFIQSLHMNSSAPPPLPPKSVTGMIVIEDCCKGMRKPCVMDLKMGTRQYGLNPTEEKKASKTAKARKSTTGSLGVRIGGMKAFVREKNEGEQLLDGATVSSSTAITSTSTPASFQLKRIEKKVGMAMTKEDFTSSIREFAASSSTLNIINYNLDNTNTSVTSPLIVKMTKDGVDDVVVSGCGGDDGGEIAGECTAATTTIITLQQRFVELLEEFRAAFASQNDFRFLV